MNKRETVKILSVIKSSYPNWANKVTSDELRQMVETWNLMLSDYEYDVVASSIKIIISNSKWPPSIAEVIEKCQYILNGGQEPLNEQAAWSLVNKAITNSSYHAKEEFEKLPKVIQNVIHDPGQLREWARSEKSSIETVVASNFMRSYKTELAREKEQQALPESVKTLISSVDVKMIE